MALVNATAAFYNASIEETRVRSATTTSSQFTGGSLAAGRWLLQVIPSADTVLVWVKLGSSEIAGGVVTATLVAGPKQMPLSTKTIIAVEFMVSGTHNDAAPAVITSAGTAECYLTRVSA